ncbi:MAG: hypothetical protein NPIRA03_12860 [Nitrospirales bacterium]|nr:MAG: hypothetical protein NPIRA03_12860 [Nitrospirales bacterium]
MKPGCSQMSSDKLSHFGDTGHKHVHVCWKNLLEAFTFCLTMTVLAKWSTNLPAWGDVIASENGPVEMMSAGVWFVAMVWCLTAGLRRSHHRIEWLGLTALCLLFGLRELDAHVWATGWNLDKSANYWNPSFPLWERLLVIGGMIIPVMIIGIVLCSRIWTRLPAAWNSRAPWIGQMMVGGVLLGFCVVVDKVHGYYLPPLGLEDAQLFLMGMEEFGEYVLGIYTVSVLWPYWQAALPFHHTDF